VFESKLIWLAKWNIQLRQGYAAQVLNKLSQGSLFILMTLLRPAVAGLRVGSRKKSTCYDFGCVKIYTWKIKSPTLMIF